MANRIKPFVDPIIFWAFLGIAVVVVFAASFFTTQQCTSIDTCSSCWNNIPKEIKSDACPNGQSCTVEPYVAQHNAITDVLICACSKASSQNYADASLNTKIVDAYSKLYGSSPTAEEACGSGLVKLGY